MLSSSRINSRLLMDISVPWLLQTLEAWTSNINTLLRISCLVRFYKMDTVTS